MRSLVGVTARRSDVGRAKAADELLEPVRRIFAKLQRSSALEQGDVQHGLRQLTEASAAALVIARSSVWTFSADRKQIRCLDLFEAATGTHSNGATLDSSSSPRYFAALQSELTIVAHDARNDARTNELEATYLAPHGIVAMLDAPIWLSGQLVGVVCHELVGDLPRVWAPWEELVASTIADFASIVLGAAERAAQARALERAANERERLLDSVLSAAPFGLAFFDRELRYTRINEWLANVNEVSRAETIGKRPSEIVPDAAVARLAEDAISAVFATGQPSRMIELSKPGIPPPTFLVKFYPVIVDERVDHVGCYVIEITAQRSNELERRELLERERAAREEAEAASRAKDEFFSVLGHELRNPLAPILTALHLMRPLGATAAVERAVIERQVAHLGRLVDDMLDVARITRGKIDLRLRPVELFSVVEKGIEMASPLIDRSGHSLVVNVPSSGFSVEADADRLAQVVSNLLTNAAKFTPRGGRIEISAARAAGEVSLYVRDNGVGLPAELLPRLFDAFVQGERRVDRSQGGLGLGLAIVHGIIVAHGGTVDARSDGVGMGSEFVVRLRARGLAEPSYQSVHPEPLRRAADRRRVLVVDDNEDAALMLAAVIQSVGHEVMTAFDGPTALSAAEHFRPDAALLDLGLPVMDGFELARRLREMGGGTRDLKLVAVTGYSSPRDFERSSQASFDRHLVKPIDTVTLGKLLTELFDGTGPSASST